MNASNHQWICWYDLTILHFKYLFYIPNPGKPREVDFSREWTGRASSRKKFITFFLRATVPNLQYANQWHISEYTGPLPEGCPIPRPGSELPAKPVSPSPLDGDDIPFADRPDLFTQTSDIGSIFLKEKYGDGAYKSRESLSSKFFRIFLLITNF